MVKTLEFTTVVIYLGIIAIVGLYYSRGHTSTEADYWIRGRRTGIIVGSITMFAAWMSGAGFVGLPAFHYALGSPAAYAINAGSVTGLTIALLLVVGPFRSASPVTLADFLEKRYPSKLIRGSIGVLMVLFMIGYIVAQFRSMGVVGAHIMGIPLWSAVLVAGAITTLYVVFGGMWAVEFTDTVQGSIMYVAMWGLAIVALAKFGGLNVWLQAAAEHGAQYTQPTAMPFYILFGLFVSWFLGYMGFAHQILAWARAQNVDVALKSVSGATLLSASFYIIIGPVGVGTLLLNPNIQNPDFAVFTFIDAVAGPVVVGIVSAAVFAASMSTTDSMILAASASITHDIYAHLVNLDASEEAVLSQGKFWNLIIGVAGIVVGILNLPLIVTITNYVAGWAASSIFFPFVLGIYWRGANTKGALAGMWGGFGAYTLLVILSQMNVIGIHYAGFVFVTVPLSAILTVAISIATGGPADDDISIEADGTIVSAD